MKTILITGGGRGLGLGVASRLAAEGHRVFLTARTELAAVRACAQIRAKHGIVSVEPGWMDLGSFASIRRFTASLRKDLRFDAVVHVAGVMQQSPTRRVAVQAGGVEETLAVNALGPFLLTHELFGRIGRETKPGRVVCVSSRLHLPGSRGQDVHYDFDDPSLDRGYSAERAYKNSKLALLWFAFELARRVPAGQFTVHGMCPGFVPETAAASTTGVRRFLMESVFPHLWFATRANYAAEHIAYVALDPALDRSTGGFWAEKAPADASREARNPESAGRFWSWAETMTGTGPWPTAPRDARPGVVAE